MKVNLTNYDIEIRVKLNYNEAIIFDEKYQGIVGLPAGSNGKALVFLSGGIDSPVAAFKMITRGMNVDFITFLNPITKTEDLLSKINLLAIKINKFNGKPGKLFIVNFELVQSYIKNNLSKIEYRTIILRR
jgi:thiamine biosynthesis protein ThiI